MEFTPAACRDDDLKPKQDPHAVVYRPKKEPLKALFRQDTGAWRSAPKTHPQQAAIGVQAGDVDLFHVKHIDVRGQLGQFLIGVFALHGQPDTGFGQAAPRPLGEIRQRGEGTRRDEVVALRQLLDPGCLLYTSDAADE